MGELIYIVNHTHKQYFCPQSSKFGEVMSNTYLMRGILEILRCGWNNCKIEFVQESCMDKIKEYEDVSDSIDWKDYYDSEY